MVIHPCRTVLLLEDDANDVFFIKRAFEQNGFTGKLIVLENGEQGIHYLSGTGDYADRQKFPLPDIIITDLKMPQVSGFDFLRWCDSHLHRSVVPIVVLSASGQSGDVAKAHGLGASAYIVKPHSTDERKELVRRLLSFWECCERPKEGLSAVAADSKKPSV